MLLLETSASVGVDPLSGDQTEGEVVVWRVRIFHGHDGDFLSPQHLLTVDLRLRPEGA